jgi:flagellar biosynthesis chaperone FliJ
MKNETFYIKELEQFVTEQVKTIENVRSYIDTVNKSIKQQEKNIKTVTKNINELEKDLEQIKIYYKIGQSLNQKSSVNRTNRTP